MAGALPNQVLIWRPGELVGRSITEGMISAPNCLSSTKAGDRAIVYQSGRDGGLVLICDFLSDAIVHPDLGHVAWATSIPINPPVPRSALMSDPALAPVFRNPIGKRALPTEAAQAVDALVGGLPDPVAPNQEIPVNTEDWRWSPAGDSFTWGNEKGMQNAICSQESAWRRLGYDEAPRKEVSPPGSNDRIDIYGPGLVAECKLRADTSALRQLEEQYLKPLNAKAADEAPTGRWFGIIITAGDYTRELVRAVAERDDIQLLVCLRDLEPPEDDPESISFVEITDPDAPHPLSPAPVASILEGALSALASVPTLLQELAEQAGVPTSRFEQLLDHDPGVQDLDERALRKMSPTDQAETLVQFADSSTLCAVDPLVALAITGGATSEEAADSLRAEPSLGLENPDELEIDPGSSSPISMFGELIDSMLDAQMAARELATIAGARPSVLDGGEEQSANAAEDLYFRFDYGGVQAVLDDGIELALRSGASSEEIDEAIDSAVAAGTE